MRDRRRQQSKIKRALRSAAVIAVILVVAVIFAKLYLPKLIYSQKYNIDLTSIPEYTDSPYVELNNNVPYFDDDDYANGTESFENYSKLDGLGRCGAAYASLSIDTMPTEERGDIYYIHPSGWNSQTYSFIDQENLYNRCHLIAFMLSGENANERNLITGTRYFNTEGMLPFELRVARYIEMTGNHVLYRVTPIYEADNLVASGVEMEAYSVEDKGDNICFNVYVYNVQPGIEIDYKTGESREADE